MSILMPIRERRVPRMQVQAGNPLGLRPRVPSGLGLCLLSGLVLNASAQQDGSGLRQGRNPPLASAEAPVVIGIDAAAGQHPINPQIYGVAYAPDAALRDLRVPLHRQGGNAATRYNWQLNADNRGNDWYFESIGDASAAAGERGDTFFSRSQNAGAQPMLTIPMIGWAAKVGPGRSKLAGFSIAKYGPQTGNDWQWFPDAGNGISSAAGGPITGNDPNDANTPADATFQAGWVQHLVSTWGTADSGGLAYYILDNEPSIWHSTHRDVHPIGATMDEVRDRMLAHAGMIKGVDPSALVVGPEEWGWSGYFYSGYDLQWGSQHGWTNLPDRTNHGGQEYLPWLLGQMKQQADATGQPPLDVFSVHYYPQGGEFSGNVSDAMQLRRNRSTRSLWDSNYKDETWINDTVKLIPRLRAWANSYYVPGTPIAITEYNWGAEGHINGATAQADILGIFGREGLDMAARWTTPDPSTPTYKAIKLFTNYDDQGSAFGDTSVQAIAPNPDMAAAFAALRSRDGALTIIVINKTLAGTPDASMTINLANFTGSGTAQVWQLTAANRIARLDDLAYAGAAIGTSFPAQSITLLVLPPTAAGEAAGAATHP